MNPSNNNPESRGAVSERELNAFVDNQLDAESRRRVRRAIRQDPSLTQEICDIDQTKDWVRQAYATPPQPPPSRMSRRQSSMGRTGLAAGMLLGVGLLAGWAGNAVLQADASSQSPTVAATEKQSQRVILHVGSAELSTMGEALDTANSLLRNARARGQENFQLQVLANAEGVDLLRIQTTPFAQRINAMIQEHSNLEFSVCGKSLSRLEQRGENVAVLPNVQVVDTAIGDVVDRLQRGWSYVQI